VGTPAPASSSEVVSLSPHTSITRDGLMQGTPNASSIRTAVTACVWLMHRSSTASKRGHAVGCDGL